MRIKDYERATNMDIWEITESFGEGSPYRDSRNAVEVIGTGRNGRSGRATIVITERGDDLIFCSLRAMDSGAGSMVMQKICDFADRHGVIIDDLCPTPYPLSKYSVGVRKLSKKELIAFYERFGFVYDKATRRMSRQPIDTTP